MDHFCALARAPSRIDAGMLERQHSVALAHDRCARDGRKCGVISPPIGSRIAARGTQDVNDPERPRTRIAGPQAGSFTSWVPFLR